MRPWLREFSTCRIGVCKSSDRFNSHEHWFRDSLLEVSLIVAEAAAELSVGRTLSPYDALIAATARVHQLTLVTRNVSDFTDTGVSVFNPWDF